MGAKLDTQLRELGALVSSDKICRKVDLFELYWEDFVFAQ